MPQAASLLMIDETYSPGGRNHTDDDGPMVMIVDENDEAYFGVTVLLLIGS